ncbi:NAD-dependent deacetylase [Gordonia araii NBRC 100433]|uniref:NAD-dependent protein deacylase n=1 Tax=Gordonia araii NBRC 100433 TaxID=1073574 RepID=G7H7Q3_9ACTN|nr:NAD-dependent deacylase [Gordonia araii]NNG99110.1 NAD-dependent deacylase [Gordonia araii NBRC 100433]GAB11878.1 NAD-dependent deacetylase [Gordonia araii NBRC 100433]
MTAFPADVAGIVRDAEHVTVFTGAGMSAESGIATFRGSGDDSLWGRFDPMRLASVDGWEDDPRLVWGWYAWRIGQLGDVEPNAGHRALADLAGDRRVVEVVTQNVDDLHERAGSTVVSHLHGNLLATRCSVCRAPYDGPVARDDADLIDGDSLDSLRLDPPACESCGGDVRPGVVWFGEVLPERDWAGAVESFNRCDLVLIVGTSGIVYPAAGLPVDAVARGVPVVEINPEPSGLTDIATHSIRATAATALPLLVSATRA